MKIKNESLAKRCEICHQSDCFVAKLNHCSRCNSTKVASTNLMSSLKRPRRIFDAAFWRQENTDPEPQDYLVPYNWLLAKQAKGELTLVERQIKNWWNSNEVLGELVGMPLLWLLVSLISTISFYMITKDLSSTIIIAIIAIPFTVVLLGAVWLRWFRRRKQAIEFYEAEKEATNEYIKDLLCKVE